MYRERTNLFIYCNVIMAWFDEVHSIGYNLLFSFSSDLKIIIIITYMSFQCNQHLPSLNFLTQYICILILLLQLLAFITNGRSIPVIELGTSFEIETYMYLLSFVFLSQDLSNSTNNYRTLNFILCTGTLYTCMML